MDNEAPDKFLLSYPPPAPKANSRSSPLHMNSNFSISTLFDPELPHHSSTTTPLSDATSSSARLSCAVYSPSVSSTTVSASIIGSDVPTISATFSSPKPASSTTSPPFPTGNNHSNTFIAPTIITSPEDIRPVCYATSSSSPQFIPPPHDRDARLSKQLLDPPLLDVQSGGIHHIPRDKLFLSLPPPYHDNSSSSSSSSSVAIANAPVPLPSMGRSSLRARRRARFLTLPVVRGSQHHQNGQRDSEFTMEDAPFSPTSPFPLTPISPFPPSPLFSLSLPPSFSYITTGLSRPGSVVSLGSAGAGYGTDEDGNGGGGGGGGDRAREKDELLEEMQGEITKEVDKTVAIDKAIPTMCLSCFEPLSGKMSSLAVNNSPTPVPGPLPLLSPATTLASSSSSILPISSPLDISATRNDTLHGIAASNNPPARSPGLRSSPGQWFSLPCGMALCFECLPRSLSFLIDATSKQLSSHHPPPTNIHDLTAVDSSHTARPNPALSSGSLPSLLSLFTSTDAPAGHHQSAAAPIHSASTSTLLSLTVNPDTPIFCPCSCGGSLPLSTFPAFMQREIESGLYQAIEFKKRVAKASSESSMDSNKHCYHCHFPCSKNIVPHVVAGLMGGTEACHEITCPSCGLILCYICMRPRATFFGLHPCPRYDLRVTCFTYSKAASWAVFVDWDAFETLAIVNLDVPQREQCVTHNQDSGPVGDEREGKRKEDLDGDKGKRLRLTEASKEMGLITGGLSPCAFANTMLPSPSAMLSGSQLPCISASSSSYRCCLAGIPETEVTVPQPLTPTLRHGVVYISHGVVKRVSGVAGDFPFRQMLPFQKAEIIDLGMCERETRDIPSAFVSPLTSEILSQHVSAAVVMHAGKAISVTTSEYVPGSLSSATTSQKSDG